MPNSDSCPICGAASCRVRSPGPHALDLRCVECAWFFTSRVNRAELADQLRILDAFAEVAT